MSSVSCSKFSGLATRSLSLLVQIISKCYITKHHCVSVSWYTQTLKWLSSYIQKYALHICVSLLEFCCHPRKVSWSAYAPFHPNSPRTCIISTRSACVSSTRFCVEGVACVRGEGGLEAMAGSDLAVIDPSFLLSLFDHIGQRVVCASGIAPPPLCRECRRESPNDSGGIGGRCGVYSRMRPSLCSWTSFRLSAEFKARISAVSMNRGVYLSVTL